MKSALIYLYKINNRIIFERIYKFIERNLYLCQFIRIIFAIDIKYICTNTAKYNKSKQMIKYLTNGVLFIYTHLLFLCNY